MYSWLLLAFNNNPSYLHIFFKPVGEHLVSKYPVGAAILAIPFYLPAVLLHLSSTGQLLLMLAHIAASFYTAASVTFLFLVMRHFTTTRNSIITALIYAFGTSTWSISSQALWQHGPSQFLHTLTLYLLVRGRKSPKLIPLSGFTLAFSVLVRVTNALVFLIFAIYIARHYKLYLRRFLLFALPPLLFLAWYNLTLFGSLAGGYKEEAGDWTTPILLGMTGLLFSPSKGLFVFSPVFLLTLPGLRFLPHRDSLFRYSRITVIAYWLLMSSWLHWHGGWCFGPRMLLDILPFLSIFFLYFFETYFSLPFWKISFITLALISVFIQMIGVFMFDFSWFLKYYTLGYRTGKPEDTWYLWSIKNSQILYYLREHCVLHLCRVDVKNIVVCKHIYLNCPLK